MLFVLCSICTGAQELPDGSVLISSRYRKGGRRFNVFTYENRKKALGTWSEAVHSSAHNNGIVTEKGSAYSTMAMLSDGALGFLYEENTYYPKDSMGYTIIFDRYTIEQITGGKYVPDIKKQH